MQLIQNTFKKKCSHGEDTVEYLSFEIALEQMYLKWWDLICLNSQKKILGNITKTISGFDLCNKFSYKLFNMLQFKLLVSLYVT